MPFKHRSIAEKFQGPFDEYNFKRKIRRNKNGSEINKKEEFFMNFKASLIENIIVPKTNGYEEKGQELIERNGLKCDLFVINR